MSQVITNAFETYWQGCLTDQVPVVLDEVVLADIPNLDITAPIDPNTGLPPQAQIVHRHPVDQRGRINNNAVAYTIVMDTTVGNFSFNAMYLVNKASGMVGMIVYKGRETKTKTDQATGTTGNSLVKSMLMEYDQAATATVTTVEAGTWQIDYSARLLGMDEQLRLQAIACFGSSAFFGDGFKLINKAGSYKVQPGGAMVGGLRIQLDAEQAVTVGAKPVGVWVDVHHAGTILSRWDNHFEFKSSTTELTDYTDSNGYRHYVAKLGTVGVDNAVTDNREVSSSAGILASIKSALQTHEQGRNHPGATESDKGFIEIANQEEACEAKSGELAVPPKYLPAVIAKYTPVAGGYRNLKLSADGASANVLITADQIVLDSVGTAGPLLAKAISVTAVTSKSGANGIDTGSVAASTWYSVWVISNGITEVALLSLSGTSPTMPEGYTYRRRVGWIRTDTTANKYPLRFSQCGDEVVRRLAAGSNITGNIMMAIGIQGVISGAGVAVALGGFIPKTATEVRVVLSTQTAAGGVVQVGLHGDLLENAELSIAGVANQAKQANIQLESGSSSIVFASNITLGVMYLRGWRDSL